MSKFDNLGESGAMLGLAVGRSSGFSLATVDQHDSHDSHDCLFRTLLDERWVLTAAHCFGTGVASLSNIEVWCEDIPSQFKPFFFMGDRILMNFV